MRHPCALVLAILVSLVAVAAARNVPQPMPPPMDPAVRLLRAINTAEADLRRSSGRYAGLRDVMTHAMVSSFGGQVALNGDEATFAPGEPVPARRLSLVVSTDSAHYSLGVVPTEACGPAWFTSERGLIYQARALGCPAL